MVVCLHGLIQKLTHDRSVMVTLTLAALLVGCCTQTASTTGRWPAPATTPDLDAEIARASELQQPILLLVIESGHSRNDTEARAALDSGRERIQAEGIIPLLLDLRASRNRATAARYHITDTPTLLGLSPEGLIVSRDQKPIARDLLFSRIVDLAQRGRELDAKLAALKAAATAGGMDSPAQMDLVNFLLDLNNDREAIPYLAAVAHSESTDTDQRIQAWVALARAHLWIGDSEKCRHEASALIAVLGDKTAVARAAGNLVLGLQDLALNRPSRARREFQAAIAAAPNSIYARESESQLARIGGQEN